MSQKPKKQRKRVAGEGPTKPVAAEPAGEIFALGGLRKPVVAGAEEAQLPTLGELDAKARECRRNGDYAKLLKLGQMAAFEIQVAPGENVAAWLALQRVRGLAGSEELSTHERFHRAADKEALAQALQSLREHTPDFHLASEFELYLRSLGYGPKAALTAFTLLVKACEAQPFRMDWLVTLRGYALRLLEDDDEQYEEEDRLTDEERERVRQSDLDVVLREAFENATQVEDLSPADQVLLTALRADLDMRLSEPWDTEKVLRWVGKLEPDASLRAACYDGENGRPALTPTAWAFQWELANASRNQLPQLLARHEAGFNDLRCEGLRLVAQGLLHPELGDEQLLAGLQLLALDVENSDGMYGHSLCLRTPEGVRHFPVGWHNFYTEELWTLMIRLVEGLEVHLPEHPRASTVVMLASIWEKAASYMSFDDDDEPAKTYDQRPDLAWLCRKISPLGLQAASVLPTSAVRLRRHLELVLRWAEADELPTSRHVWADLSDAHLDTEQREGLLSLLENLYPLMVRMRGPLSAFFEELLPRVIVEVVNDLEPDHRSEALNIASMYADELVASDHAHHLAWLAHTTSRNYAATDWYTRILRGRGAHKAWAAKNLQGLLNKLTDLADVEAAIDLLSEAEFADDQEPNRATLLSTARSKQSVLEQREQYARTAVNRWPKLTQQARQILGVLAQIKSYRGFAELGSYAGMDASWAERHYDKLVETGMVLVGPDGVAINPHIAPLLARENQHAVVGRIVRASGTTAVKQVFNSQREFTIYQAMVQLCPNHLVFPNCGLQSFMTYERMKELVVDDDFGYYLRASVDILVVSSTTYLPLLAIEVDSNWHDTDRQKKNDSKKDRLFATAGVPFLRLQPVGNPSEAVIRGQVAEHLDDLVRTLREDMPGYDQARALLTNLSEL